MQQGHILERGFLLKNDPNKLSPLAKKEKKIMRNLPGLTYF